MKIKRNIEVDKRRTYINTQQVFNGLVHGTPLTQIFLDKQGWKSFFSPSIPPAAQSEFNIQ